MKGSTEAGNVTMSTNMRIVRSISDFVISKVNSGDLYLEILERVSRRLRDPRTAARVANLANTRRVGSPDETLVRVIRDTKEVLGIDETFTVLRRERMCEASPTGRLGVSFSEISCPWCGVPILEHLEVGESHA